MQVNQEHFDSIHAFDMSVKYTEISKEAPENVHDSHAHAVCEIYINVSGDVSFVVEGNIYPVKSGDIIITRPFEYHHCVYHSSKLHKHFWILFSSSGNEFLLDTFFNRKAGHGNHLSLSPEKTEELFSLCHEMTKKETVESTKYYNFFKLIHILQSSNVVNDSEVKYPADVTYAVEYIHNHFDEAITVSEIAKGAYVSVNTLERHFTQALRISPSAYIKKKRMAYAVKLLSEGYSVTETARLSGFSDDSNFIALFKKTYGVTPLQYKKDKHKI